MEVEPASFSLAPPYGAFIAAEALSFGLEAQHDVKFVERSSACHFDGA